MNPEQKNAVSVEIKNHAYNPPELTIEKGVTVVFTNQDQDEHTVTAMDDSFDIELPGGTSEQIDFTEPGTVDYYCRYHPDMKGTIVVE